MALDRSSSLYPRKQDMPLEWLSDMQVPKMKMMPDTLMHDDVRKEMKK
jgi:hypothetical protein